MLSILLHHYSIVTILKPSNKWREMQILRRYLLTKSKTSNSTLDIYYTRCKVKMTFDRFCFFPSSSTCSFSRVKTLHATVEQRSQLHQTLGLKFKDENVIFLKKDRMFFYNNVPRYCSYEYMYYVIIR